MKRAAIFLFVVVLIAIWSAVFLTSTREVSPSVALGRTGESVEVSAVPGARMTLVHFWGTWCGPCRNELPVFTEFAAEFESKGVSYVAIANDPDFKRVDNYLREEGIQLDFLLDPRGSVMRKWKVNAVPTTFVISPEGNILARYTGMVDWSNPLQRKEILRLGGLKM